MTRHVCKNTGPTFAEVSVSKGLAVGIAGIRVMPRGSNLTQASGNIGVITGSDSRCYTTPETAQNPFWR